MDSAPRFGWLIVTTFLVILVVWSWVIGVAAAASPTKSIWPEERDAFVPVKPAVDHALVRRAAAALSRSCPGLERYRADLTIASPAATEEGDADHYLRRDHGWPRWAVFDYRVASSPRSVPASFRAGGHRCEYRVAVDGPRAGVDTSKSQCASLCLGRAVPEQSRNHFVPVAGPK